MTINLPHLQSPFYLIYFKSFHHSPYHLANTHLPITTFPIIPLSSSIMQTNILISLLQNLQIHPPTLILPLSYYFILFHKYKIVSFYFITLFCIKCISLSIYRILPSIQILFSQISNSSKLLPQSFSPGGAVITAAH